MGGCGSSSSRCSLPCTDRLPRLHCVCCFALVLCCAVGTDHVGPPTVLQKIAAGLTTSAIGITVASPTDVVKVRLQAEGRLPEGVPRRYTGALDAYRKIVQQEGVLGLWTGYGPNLARNWSQQHHTQRTVRRLSHRPRPAHRCHTVYGYGWRCLLSVW